MSQAIRTHPDNHLTRSHQGQLLSFYFCDHELVIFRREKNRLNATASRERTKEYVMNLERWNALLWLLNKTLLEELKKLEELYKNKP